MIQRINHGGKELALIIRHSFKKDGIEFFTPSDSSQQIGYMKRPTGYVISPHTHNPVLCEVLSTKEVLVIKSGRVRVDFYNDDQGYLESTVLETGDVILLASGGHGFVMLEETEIIEVREGHYTGDHNKIRFKSIPKDQIKMRKTE
jgi:hypothetical protein